MRAPEPLTPEEERRLRKRDKDWAEGFQRTDEHRYEHPDTQCQADIDRTRLLATLDEARADNLALTIQIRAHDDGAEARADTGELARPQREPQRDWWKDPTDPRVINARANRANAISPDTGELARLREALTAIPLGTMPKPGLSSVAGWNRYDTDDEHVLHLFESHETGRGMSWDIRAPRAALTAQHTEEAAALTDEAQP